MDYSNYRTPTARVSGECRRIYFCLLVMLLLPTMAISLVMAGQVNPKGKSALGLGQYPPVESWIGRPDSKNKGAQPWLFKDWTTWTSNDCGLVLDNSPWSHRTTSVSFYPGYVDTVVQIRSALPIRQALLRDLQLKMRYDKMDVQKKQEFDQQHPSDFNADIDNDIVIDIRNVSDRPPRNATAESGPYAPDAATQTALRLATGYLVQPIRTTALAPPSGVDVFGNETEYTFRRTVGGEALYSPTDSFLTIILGVPLIVDKKSGEVEQKDFQDSGRGYVYWFKITDLMYKGKLEY